MNTKESFRQIASGNPSFIYGHELKNSVAQVGFETRTYAFPVDCSTNRAIEPMEAVHAQVKIFSGLHVTPVIGI